MKLKDLTWSAFLGFLSALVCSTHAAELKGTLPSAAEFGNLVYPAKGNIELDEGTLELWVISAFDTDVKELSASDEDIRRANLFDLVFPDEKWHYVLYFIARSNAFAMVGYGAPPQPYVWVGPPHWKSGEPHHVVFTWSGRKRSVFIDGVCEWKGAKGPNVARDVDVGGEIRGELTSAFIQIGAGHSFLTVDEIQIRKVALTPDEIVKAKAAPLMGDANTLLLDHCEDGPPEVIAGQTEETGRKLSGQYEIVDGKFGKAIRLWKEKE